MTNENTDSSFLPSNVACPSLYKHAGWMRFNWQFDALQNISVDLHSDRDLSSVLPSVQNRLNRLFNDFANFMQVKGYRFEISRRNLHLSLYKYPGSSIGGALYRYDGPNNQFEAYSDLNFDLIAPPIGNNPHHDQYRHETAHLLHAWLVAGFSDYQPITEGFAELVQYFLGTNNPCPSQKTSFLHTNTAIDIRRIFQTQRTSQDDMYTAGYWFNVYMYFRGSPQEHLAMLTPLPQEARWNYNYYYGVWEDQALTRAKNYILRHQQGFSNFLQEMAVFCANPNRGQFNVTVPTGSNVSILSNLILAREVATAFKNNQPLIEQLREWDDSATELLFQYNSNNYCKLTKDGFDCGNSHLNGSLVKQLEQRFIGSLIEMFIYGDNCYQLPTGQLYVQCSNAHSKCYISIENEFISLIKGSNWASLIRLTENAGFSQDKIESWQRKRNQFYNAAQWSQKKRRQVSDWDEKQCKDYRAEIAQQFPPMSLTSTRPSVLSDRNSDNLIDALVYGDLNYIRGAFDFGEIDVNSLDKDKKTPLLLIAIRQKCNYPVLQYLLPEGAYKILDNQSLETSQTPRELILAKCRESEDFMSVQRLLDQYPKSRANPLQTFCGSGGNSIVEDNPISSGGTTVQWGEAAISGLFGLGTGFVASITNAAGQYVGEHINKQLPENLQRYNIGKGVAIATGFSLNAATAAMLPISLGATASVVAGTVGLSLAAQGIGYGVKGVLETSQCLKPIKTLVAPTLPLVGNVVDIFANGKSITQNGLNSAAQFLGGVAGGVVGKRIIKGWILYQQKQQATGKHVVIQMRHIEKKISSNNPLGDFTHNDGIIYLNIASLNGHCSRRYANTTPNDDDLDSSDSANWDNEDSPIYANTPNTSRNFLNPEHSSSKTKSGNVVEEKVTLPTATNSPTPLFAPLKNENVLKARQQQKQQDKQKQPLLLPPKIKEKGEQMFFKRQQQAKQERNSQQVSSSSGQTFSQI